MTPGEILGHVFDVAQWALIFEFYSRSKRYRGEAARWHRLAELNIRAHLVRSGEIRAAERLAARIEDGVIPADLLAKLGTLRPGPMARRRYSAGGYTPGPWDVAKATAELDRKIAARIAENKAIRAQLNKNDPASTTEGNDHE